MIADLRMRKRLDLPLLLLTYLIAALGVLIVFSASYGQQGGFANKQVVWIVAGTAGLVGAALFDFHNYARFLKPLYLLNLLSLIAVRSGHFHSSVNGAARWIAIGPFQYQPSEIAKVVVILTLAVFLAKNAATIKTPLTLTTSLLLVAAPAALITTQPDLGTGLVVIAIWFAMVFVAGAEPRHLFALFGAAAVLFAGLWVTGVWPKPFQRQRLLIFLGLREDAKKTGYHIAQARIAIGSGGLFGKGYLKSTQVQGGWVPERQTDFIFSDIGEEFGFAGCLAVICLYGILIWRGVRIVVSADEDATGKLIATGVVAMLAFHVIENIGMNVGVMPVAGVPLVLISYGGSSMIVTLFSIGLLESIALHRHQLTF
ncbi:MAG TPA: rod shape-determining protein RodA [Chthonomonadaceae bacterium]|nr:rod shape-determining protein RodA [Chthonomonadaceae bacterium]